MKAVERRETWLNETSKNNGFAESKYIYRYDFYLTFHFLSLARLPINFKGDKPRPLEQLQFPQSNHGQTADTKSIGQVR